MPVVVVVPDSSKNLGKVDSDEVTGIHRCPL